MSTSVEAVPPAVDQPLPPAAQALYGGFWVRFAAFLVDGVIVWLVWGAVALFLYLLRGKFSPADDTMLNLISIPFGLFYNGYFLSSERMATPGKRLFGLYVTDIAGGRLSFPHAVGRQLAAILSGLLFCIGYVMIAFSDRKQALHDRMAGTLVHRRPGGSPGAMIFVSAFVFLLVFGGGMVYAVGKSTFYNFAARMGMNDLYEVMSANKVPIQEYAKKHQEWPTTWEQVESANGKNPMNGIDSITQLFVKDIHLDEFGAMVAVLDFGDKSGKLRLAPQRVENNLGWTCTASPDIVKYMPEICVPKE